MKTHEENLTEFVARCQSPEFQKIVSIERKRNHYISNKWARENPKLMQQCIKKYFNTEKGKIAHNKCRALRAKRIREFSKLLTYEEKQAIIDFYLNCPEGYEVDHRCPLSKGGMHHPCNLQYLTKEENRKKAAKLYWEFLPDDEKYEE